MHSNLQDCLIVVRASISHFCLGYGNEVINPILIGTLHTYHFPNTIRLNTIILCWWKNRFVLEQWQDIIYLVVRGFVMNFQKGEINKSISLINCENMHIFPFYQSKPIVIVPNNRISNPFTLLYSLKWIRTLKIRTKKPVKIRDSLNS